MLNRLRQTSRPTARSARPRLEALEDRLAPAVTVSLINRVLYAQGDAASDVIRLDNFPTHVAIAGIGVLQSAFDAVVINPGGGYNYLQINGTVRPTYVQQSGANSIDIGSATLAPDLRAPLQISGPGGSTLRYNDQANATPSLTYSISADSATVGRVSRNGLADVTFQGVAAMALQTGTLGSQNVYVRQTLRNTSTTVRGGQGFDNFIVGDTANRLQTLGFLTIDGGGGLNTLLVNDTGTTVSADYTVTSSAVTRPLGGAQSIGYTNLTILEVRGADASSSYHVLSTQPITSTVLRGGNYLDFFQVGDAADRWQTPGGVVVDGGPGGNILTVIDKGTTADARYDVNSFFVSRTASAQTQYVHYSQFDSVYLLGGGGRDTFDVRDTNAFSTTTVVGGPADDTFRVGDPSGQVQTPTNVAFVGGGGRDAITFDDSGASGPVAYGLTGRKFTRSGTGSVLLGGIEAVTVNGGSSASNTYSVAQMGAVTAALNLGRGGAVAVSGFQQGAVAVNAPSGTGTLTVDDSAASAGSTYGVSASALRRSGAADVLYSGVGAVRLVAGARGAVQVGDGVSAVPLSVDVPGGGGLLDYSARLSSVYVNLRTGEATDLASFSGIRDVTGGSGDDVLVGDGTGNVLTGGDGRDLLIASGAAGAGAAALAGGGDDDILIGGSTAYDRDRAKLQAILSIWGDVSRPQADRVAELTTGADGAPLLDETTVFGNQGDDSLTGGAGLDLFFATDGKDRTDADADTEATVPLLLGGLRGSVYIDRNGNGRRDPGEKGIGGVTVLLYRQTPAGDVLVGTRVTRPNGRFDFGDWPPGTFRLVEVQPEGSADGQDRAGTLGGTLGNDVIGDIVILPGQLGTEYEFGERRH